MWTQLGQAIETKQTKLKHWKSSRDTTNSPTGTISTKLPGHQVDDWVFLVQRLVVTILKDRTGSTDSVFYFLFDWSTR